MHLPSMCFHPLVNEAMGWLLQERTWGKVWGRVWGRC